MTPTPLTRLAVLDDYQDVARSCADWDALRSRGIDVTFLHAPPPTDPTAKAAALQDFDAIAAMRERTVFDAATLGRLPRLRLLVTTGRRNASIDLAAASREGITVCGTDGSAAGAPELTWALLLAALRRLPEEEANLRTGRWQRTLGREAEGLHLGVLGLGRIGTRVAGYGRAFGMRVTAAGGHLTPDRARAAGVGFAGSAEELAAKVGALSVHLALTPQTRGIVSEPVLRALGPDGLLVNTARAGIVDTEAMVRGLTEGWLGSAALDVFDEEPLPAHHPLLTAPRTVLTPHLGFVTRQSYERFHPQTVQDVIAYLDGAPLRVLQ